MDDLNRLKFRRQYIIGPESQLVTNYWKSVSFCNDVIVSFHTDIEFSIFSDRENTIACLGYLLDPYNPEASNTEILKGILSEGKDSKSIVKTIDRMAGRFILILKWENELSVLNDAAGFRQVFYYTDKNEKIWISSQPALLKQIFKLNENRELIKDTEKLFLFSNTQEYWFPGKHTLVENVFHLTANHLLDLKSGEVHRYWPVNRIEPVRIKDAVNKAGMILENILIAAEKRYPLAFGITCGLDSRTILSVSKNLLERIYFFTHTHERLNQKGNDIVIPNAILNREGIEHSIIEKDNNVDESFSKIFDKNVSGARKIKKEIAYTLYKDFSAESKDFLVINGVCSELIRYFYNFPRGFKFNGHKLSVIAGFKGSLFAQKDFDEWLNDIKELDDIGIETTELFYWENRNSNWAAMSYHEYDIAFDSLSPFNCRLLLETILGVHKRYRKPPIYKFHRNLIRENWKELLDFPINPPVTSKEKISYLLQILKLFDFLKFLKYQWVFKSSQKEILKGNSSIRY